MRVSPWLKIWHSNDYASLWLEAIEMMNTTADTTVGEARVQQDVHSYLPCFRTITSHLQTTKLGTEVKLPEDSQN